MSEDKLTVHIVFTGENSLLENYAGNLQKELEMLGCQINLGRTEDSQADVNHYMCVDDLELRYKGTYKTTDTTVRTVLTAYGHSGQAGGVLKDHEHRYMACICTSIDEIGRLISEEIPRNKIYYIAPVVLDRGIKPKKINLGITNRCYHHFDFRKRDDLILQVCQQLEPDFFRFKIMGSGWDAIVEQLKGLKFEVEYYASFNREVYKRLIPSLDYWLYYGFDEGAMGYLDALAAGVKTIATPQGFHLDTKCGLTHPCKTVQDFIGVLRNIQNEKKVVVDSVMEWGWKDCAKRHMEIWKYLVRTKR